MRVAAIVSALVAAATAVQAQGAIDAAYIQQVITALNSANLTSLAQAAQGVANTTEGAALLAQLQGSNKTLLAPSNEAFAAVDPAVASNTTLLANILSYHILNASLPLASLAEDPNHTVARSLYNNMMYPGNATLPVVLYQSEGENNQTIEIQQPGGNVNGSGPVEAANFQIYIIDGVLSLPPDLATAATELLPSLATVISDNGLLEPLSMIEGITVFAPNDAAISGLGDALTQLNQTQVQGILANHVINGTAVFSTQLTSSNYTSAGGQQFMFVANDTGAFVMSGNSTARIIQSDIVIANGVVHVIDGVLLNQGANTEAAASAASSNVAAATSTAAATGTGAGVVGNPTGMGTAATSGAAASSTAAGAATKLGLNGMGAWIGSAVAVVGGIVLGASMV